MTDDFSNKFPLDSMHRGLHLEMLLSIFTTTIILFKGGGARWGQGKKEPVRYFL